jgi:hypothetical protein
MRRYMPRYMLDTDMVSYALRGEGRVGARLLERRPRDLCLSVITVLRFLDKRSTTASCFIGAARRPLVVGPCGLIASPQA